MPIRKTASQVLVSGGNRNSSNFCHCRRGGGIAVRGSRQLISPVCRDVPGSLPPIFIAQAEIVAEHRLERFALAMLKISDARGADRSESGPNSSHVRTLAPDGHSEHLSHYFPHRLLTIVAQPRY